MFVLIGFRIHEDDPTSLLSLRLDGEKRRDTRSQIHEHVNKSSIKIHLLASFTKLYLRFVVIFLFSVFQIIEIPISKYEDHGYVRPVLHGLAGFGRLPRGMHG